MKKNLFGLMLAVMVCFGFVGTVAMPQTAFAAADTIGYVDFRQAMFSHPDFRSASAALNLEMQNAEKEFSTQAAKLDAKGQSELQAKLQERVAKREQALMEPINKKVLAAIKKVAKAEGVTVVLSSSNVIDGGVDMTKDVIAALGK